MDEGVQRLADEVSAGVTGDGEVVDGHLRLKAAQKLGMTEVPVILCDEWTEAQVKAFRLLVNRSATWAEFDSELVTLELEELSSTSVLVPAVMPRLKVQVLVPGVWTIEGLQLSPGAWGS